jgi:hypothetical protein
MKAVQLFFGVWAVVWCLSTLFLPHLPDSTWMLVIGPDGSGMGETIDRVRHRELTELGSKLGMFCWFMVFGGVAGVLYTDRMLER